MEAESAVQAGTQSSATVDIITVPRNPGQSDVATAVVKPDLVNHVLPESIPRDDENLPESYFTHMDEKIFDTSSYQSKRLSDENNQKADRDSSGCSSEEKARSLKLTRDQRVKYRYTVVR